MVTYLGSLVQYCCGDRGTLQINITGMCGEHLQRLGQTWFAPAHGAYAFLLYTPQAVGCSAEELSEVGPGLRELLRSKPLRFRFSGSPQRGRLGWACILCPSQVRAAQATRCLASAVSPGGECVLSPLQSQPLGFLSGSGCTRLQCAICLFEELISCCDPPGRNQPSRIPRGFG